MTGRLAGKVAIVSGAAQGMGASHARAVVREGGQVVIGDILDNQGSLLADELGDSARFVHLDVTSEDDWDTAVSTAISEFGKLNVLVNNAGIVNFGFLDNYSLDQWNAILAVNLTGQFLGIKAARNALVDSAPSSIVNISSTAGITGSAGQHGYAASKFAVRGLTKTVAAELGSKNVRANSVHPGTIKTPMTEGMDLSSLAAPIRRIGEDIEVSNLVVYLASDESTYSTGSEYLVDGGLVNCAGAVVDE
ncbi:SDR family oxidoreductase [Rhodococcus sp. 14-2483-1-2]|uniref:SDR family oxidoreductase n=1 Tax=Rhodococcus sp. 14-2483-1-2 TaxID=2023147 RepID=UPI000B9ACFF9|nr:SDR family oxidoreductase [Rhodococcus sp. 14-2483-1-2]OZF26163.1 3-alpha-hydroxysteroid dehydrogenase [Rhodococcus sp. 14-2483-1-2]